MRLALDHACGEALLEDMTAAAVPVVEALCVNAVQAMKRRRELSAPTLDDHVEVCAEGAPGVES